MADTEVVDWAADVEAEEREKNRAAGITQAPEVVKEVRPQLPEIPKTFDPDTYEEPEPIIVKKGSNMYTKYSWHVVVDPNADPNDEYPAMVIQEVVENFKTETLRVNKRVAMRRKWAKYGMSEYDGPGPNAGTTNMQQEDCHIMFLNKRAINKQEEDKPILSQDEEQELQKIRTQIIQQLTLHNLTGKSIGEASYMDKMGPAMAGGAGDGRGPSGATSFMMRVKATVGPETSNADGATTDRPRVGQNRPGDRGQRMDDEGCTVRVTNLNETVTEGDIQDLFGSIGRIRRTYLARDKRTGRAKGFAYVTYESRMDAQKAIRGLNKYTFDYLVLNVELSQRNNN